jgi:hypothetical protein
VAVFVSAVFGLGMAALFTPSCNGDDNLNPTGDDASVPADDAAAPDARSPDVNLVNPDAELIVLHDGGAPQSCTETCECPQGLGCVTGTCRVLAAPVYCCNKPNCPTGQACLAENDRPSSCSPPDSGPPPVTCERPDAALPQGADAGLGQIGQSCNSDFECDQAQGFTCWERFEAPFVWGYCTLEGCVGGCPLGSQCVQFNIPPPDGPVTGCLQTCLGDADCRTDAYCFFIAGAGFSICLPNCRDDILDCAPRDGNTFCSPITGECEANMCHASPGGSGDACINNQDCAEGHVCMTEEGWGFPRGMCSRVCSGLPESQPCESGETCQDFAGVGLCFKDCAGGACPARVDAVCSTLDVTWLTPSCIAQ